MVEESQLAEELKTQLLQRVELTTAATEKYIEDHKSELELDATNKEILDEIDRERVVKLEVQQRMAEMVDQFNKLVDEHRYAEAEVVANRLYEMAPDELVAQQVNKQAKMIRRERWSRGHQRAGRGRRREHVPRHSRRRRPTALARHRTPTSTSATTGTRSRIARRSANSARAAASRNWRSSRSSRRRCCRSTTRRR